MCNCGHGQQAGGRAGAVGFTLTEVLVVMLILSLLLGILMPIIGVVRLRLQVARSKVRVETLANGVHSFALEHNGRFPGQSDTELWDTVYTGSQVLAAHMFGYYDDSVDVVDAYHNIELDNPQPGTTGYMTYDGSMLFHCGSDKNFLSDHFNAPKPVAYYPAGGGVGTGQFRFVLNSIFTGSTKKTFGHHIKDTGYGASGKPYNNNEFLLIGPGADRIYFNEDDVHNWTN